MTVVLHVYEYEEQDYPFASYEFDVREDALEALAKGCSLGFPLHRAMIDDEPVDLDHDVPLLADAFDADDFMQELLDREVW